MYVPRGQGGYRTWDLETGDSRRIPWPMMKTCRICGAPIDAARLEAWPWAVTYSPPCSDENARESQRRASRAYKRRRRQRARRE